VRLVAYVVFTATCQRVCLIEVNLQSNEHLWAYSEFCELASINDVEETDS